MICKLKQTEKEGEEPDQSSWNNRFFFCSKDKKKRNQLCGVAGVAVFQNHQPRYYVVANLAPRYICVFHRWASLTRNLTS
jgi:hypothetical protein